MQAKGGVAGDGGGAGGGAVAGVDGERAARSQLPVGDDVARTCGVEREGGGEQVAAGRGVERADADLALAVKDDAAAATGLKAQAGAGDEVDAAGAGVEREAAAGLKHQHGGVERRGGAGDHDVERLPLPPVEEVLWGAGGAAGHADDAGAVKDGDEPGGHGGREGGAADQQRCGHQGHEGAVAELLGGRAGGDAGAVENDVQAVVAGVDDALGADPGARVVAALQAGHDDDAGGINNHVAAPATGGDGVAVAARAGDGEGADAAGAADGCEVDPAVVGQAARACNGDGAAVAGCGAAAGEDVAVKAQACAAVEQNRAAVARGAGIGAAIGSDDGAFFHGNVAGDRSDAGDGGRARFGVHIGGGA